MSVIVRRGRIGAVSYSSGKIGAVTISGRSVLGVSTGKISAHENQGAALVNPQAGAHSQSIERIKIGAPSFQFLPGIGYIDGGYVDANYFEDG